MPSTSRRCAPGASVSRRLMQEGRAGAKGKIQDSGCVLDPRWSSIYAAAATGVEGPEQEIGNVFFINPCGHRAHEASNPDNRKDWAHRKWETQTEREATINSKENKKVYEKGKVISTGNNRTVTRLQTLSIGLTPSCIGRMADGLAWTRKINHHNENQIPQKMNL